MSREQVINSIRASLKRAEALDPNVIRSLEARDSAMQPHVQPAFDEDLVERVIRKHEAVHGSVVRIASLDDLAATVHAYLEELDLPDELVAASHGDLVSALKESAIKVEFRPTRGDDLVALSVADAAIAETGTLVLVSSAHAPMLHNYLPDHHLVLLRTSSIVRWQEDVWRILKEQDNFPPRGIAMITGPSKTADVEQTLEYGAHGPRAVHLIVFNDSSD